MAEEKMENESIEISISDILIMMWGGKYIYIIFVVLSIVLAGFYISTAEYKYESSMLIVPPDVSKIGTSSGLGAFAAIGSAFGISAGNINGGQPIDELKGNLYTLKVAAELEERYHILQLLMPDLWNSETNSWREPSGFFYDLKQSIRKLIGMPPRVAPGPQLLQNFIVKNLSVFQFSPGGGKNDSVPYWKLSFRASDPELAAFILGRLYKVAESDLKERKEHYTELLIAHVERRLAEVTLKERRDALLNTLEGLERELMLSSPQIPYSSLIVDDATINRSPISPKPVVVMIVSVFIAIFLATVVIFGLHYLRILMGKDDRQDPIYRPGL